ncbi:MAG: phage minor capsid protein, partial [Ruminococcus flavefaciens]|nr:phage minor capsid protein [Ruminococcus flavefaciens]
LKRNIGRHKQEEQQEGFEWSAWQAEKLRNINKFRRECSAIMSEYTDVIDIETRQLMEEQFKEGVNGITALQSEKISEAPQAVLTSEPEFFGVDDTKVTKLIGDVVNLEKHAETAALRTMDDVYRQTVNKAQLAMSTGSVTLQQAVDMTVRDFLDKGINCIVYRDGRRVNIADYVRMALRTTSTRAKLQGEAAKIKSLGYDTVHVTKYSMCSDTCLPWQGRPYIDDVFSFWDGEIKEHENGQLWGKSNYCGKWFPLLSTAIHSGLFHPNCRHTITLYVDGDPLPKAIDNSEIEKRYKLEQKQRRLENEVRRAKRKAEGFSDPDNVKKANKKLREAQKKLRDFINKVNEEGGKLILKRDYDHEKIYSGENVDFSAESGIIESGSDDVILENQRYGRNKTTLVNKTYIESGEYKRKYDNATDNQEVNKTLYDCAKTALKHRSGTVFEDMYWIDSETGRIALSVTDSTDERAIIYTDKIRNTIKNNKNIVTLHTHPSSMPPSISDLNSCCANKYKIGFVACHDGRVFGYTSNTVVNEQIYNMYIQRYTKDGYDEFDAQLKALERLSESFDIKVWEVNYNG